MLRLPADVQPGMRCDAVLPSGVRVRFVAPAGAKPGQVVIVENTGKKWREFSESNNGVVEPACKWL